MADLGFLPRLAIIELLLGQALSSSTILWTELSQKDLCEDNGEELVDEIVLAMVHLEEIKNCLKRSKTR